MKGFIRTAIPAAVAAALGACAPSQSPQSDTAAAPQDVNLIAIQDSAVPYVAPNEVVIGGISRVASPDCVLNAPVHVLSRGLEQGIADGDYILRNSSGSPGVALVSVLAPAEHGNSDKLVIIDELEFGPRGVQSRYGQVQRLFQIARRGSTLRLSAKAGDHIVCVDPGRAPTADALAVVETNNSQRSLYVTAVPAFGIDPAQIVAMRNAIGARAAASKAYEESNRYRALDGSPLAVGSTVTPSRGFAVDYSASTAGTTWDNCRPDRANPAQLTCSGGTKINLEQLLPKPPPFTLFGNESQRYLRLVVLSEPRAARIYMGPLRQGEVTNTALDVRAEAVPTIRLEKDGYQPCAYGPQWTAKIIPGPSQTLEAKCKMEPIRPRTRRR